MSALETLKIRPRFGIEGDAEQEGWLVSYADLITLLFIFFAVMLSISSVNRAKFDRLTQQLNQTSSTNLQELKKTLDQEIDRQHLESKVSTEIGEEGLQVRFTEKALFASGEADIADDGSKVLSSFAKVLSTMPGEFRMAVEGHTDNMPIHTEAFPSNWALSADRAVNVLHFLSENGVNEKRMMVRAYANTRPMKANSSDARDRRVTLLVY